MGRKLILSIVLLIFMFSLVSAIDTKIKIKTLPVHKISIFIYPSGKLSSVESFHKDSDIYGSLEVVHSSSVNKIDVLVKISKDGEKIFLEKFEGYKAGGPISIRMDNEEITGNYVEQTEESSGNETVNGTSNDGGGGGGDLNASVSENEAEANGTSITGSVISDSNNDGISRNAYFIIAGIMIVLFVVFLLYRSFSVSKPNDPVSKEGALSSRTSEANLADREVRRLRMQLTASQREIVRLKNENQIKEIQRKIEEEKKEVDRLRGGAE